MENFLLISIPHLIFYVFLAIWYAQHIMSKARVRFLPSKNYLEVKAEAMSSFHNLLFVYALT